MKGRYKNVMLFVLVLAGVCVNLTACSATELEERCFPMMVTVGYENGKVSYGAAFPKEDAAGQSDATGSKISAPEVSGVDFEASKEMYESHLNKQADYNHLKVLVFEDEIMEKKDIYDEIIDALARTEAFPRNTYVCVAEDVEDLYELESSISQDLGTYLEEYIKKHEKDKGRILTLGDLMNEKANQTKVLYLPYLDVEEKYVEWQGYMNTYGKIWQESIVE